MRIISFIEDPSVIRDVLNHHQNRKQYPYQTEVDVLRISAKSGYGVDQLKEAIHRVLLGVPGDRHTEVMIANIRHKAVLERTVAFLCQAREGPLNLWSSNSATPSPA